MNKNPLRYHTEVFRMSSKDVEVEKKSIRFKDYLQVTEYKLKHTLFRGGWSEIIKREVIERGHVGAVLLYDPELNVFVLTEQFRPAAHAAKNSSFWDQNLSPWMIECVAGVIDDGESPEELCLRESLEEANCQILELHFLFKYFSSPGCLTETVYLYCGRVNASNAGGYFGLRDEGEDIRVFTATPAEAYQMIEDGKIVNSMTILAVQWFQMNGDRLRNLWLGEGK